MLEACESEDEAVRCTFREGGKHLEYSSCILKFHRLVLKCEETVSPDATKYAILWLMVYTVMNPLHDPLLLSSTVIIPGSGIKRGGVSRSTLYSVSLASE